MLACGGVSPDHVSLWRCISGSLMFALSSTSCTPYFRRDEEDAYRLVRMPDASITLSRVISKGIPHHALASEPHFKISFVSPKFEVRTDHIPHSIAWFLLSHWSGEQQLCSMECIACSLHFLLLLLFFSCPIFTSPVRYD